MEKKLLAILLLVVCITTVFTGCKAKNNETSDEGDNDKLTIVATLFPQYDFTREIVGDKAEVKLLMSPGVESHSYEPTPADIIKINKSDLFIYTGEYMEGWAQSIIEGIDNKNVEILDVSKNIKLDKGEGEDGHNDDIETSHEGSEEHDEQSDEKEVGHNHDYDPHIWTSIINAKAMVDNILESVCELDPENADYYTKNANNYKEELNGLDKEFKDIFATAKRNEIIFAGKFALHYFAEEYGMDYEAAYDTCSTEAEPSAKVVANLIDEIKEEKIPVIYYAELTEPKVAKSISEETGVEMLVLHSCHNVSKEDFNNGVNYLSLMKQNAENLKVGLN